MKFKSLLRAGKVALLFGLALGANASNFNSHMNYSADVRMVGTRAMVQPVGTFLDTLLAVMPSSGSGAYSILAGLGVMGTIALRRKT